MTLLEILDKHDVLYRTEGDKHCRSGWVQIECPFCGAGSGKFHMGFNLANWYSNCWKCGPHFISKTLKEITGQSYVSEHEESAPVLKGTDRRGKLILPNHLGELLPAHKHYLKSRGFSPEKMQKLWKIQGIGIADKLQWRIFIPIHHKGKVVSWTTRKLNDDGLRYISANPDQEAVSAKRLLYGGDYIRHAAIVHEGPLDVWATGPGAVATFGTSFTSSQINLIARIPVRIVCFDSDKEAQRRARQLCDALEVFPGETKNVVLDAKDAGSASPKEIKALRRMLE